MIIKNIRESTSTSVDQAKVPTVQTTEPKVSERTPPVEPQAMESATEVEQRVQEVAQKIDAAASELAVQAMQRGSSP